MRQGGTSRRHLRLWGKRAMTPPQEGRHVTFVHGRLQRLMIFLAGQLSLKVATRLLQTGMHQQVMLTDKQSHQQACPAQSKGGSTVSAAQQQFLGAMLVAFKAGHSTTWLISKCLQNCRKHINVPPDQKPDQKGFHHVSGAPNQTCSGSGPVPRCQQQWSNASKGAGGTIETFSNQLPFFCQLQLDAVGLQPIASQRMVPAFASAMCHGI